MVQRQKSRIEKVYDPSLTIKEMAKLSGCKVISVRKYLGRKGLKYKHERNVPEYIERYPEGELPPWYDPKLSVKEMTAKRFKATEMSTRFFLKAHRLPYRHVKAMAPGIDSDLKWYDPNKTIAEMAEATGRTYAAMAIYLRRKKLPYKDLSVSIEEDMKNWYDPERTLKEMVDISGRTLGGIYEFLRSKNLPYKVKTA